MDPDSCISWDQEEVWEVVLDASLLLPSALMASLFAQAYLSGQSKDMLYSWIQEFDLKSNDDNV